MRILVWGINYHPEAVGIAPYNTGLCEYLTKSGHEVEMVTSFPYYPMWKKAPADRHRLFRSEVVNGVRVHRCWHFVPRRPSGLRRIVHEASFVFFSTLRALTLTRADALVVVSPPLLLGAAAWLLGRLKRMPHVLHIQDLQPDAALSLGMLKRGWFVALLRKLENFNYRTASRVLVISEGMLRELDGRGIERLVCFPNWIMKNGKQAERGAFRRAMGIGNDEFVMLYSGNIGMKQGLDLIVEAASRVKQARLVICGDGAARPVLEQLIAGQRAGNMTLLPLQPEEEYSRMMEDADVCIVSQRAGSGAAFFPSKLLSCVAHGKPVLAVADEQSELARVVREEGLGMCAPPEMEAVVEAMRELPAIKERLEQYVKNGSALTARFEHDRVLSEFERLLEAVAREGEL